MEGASELDLSPSQNTGIFVKASGLVEGDRLSSATSVSSCSKKNWNRRKQR